MIYCFHNHTQSNKISYRYKKRTISVLREHVQYIACTCTYTVKYTFNCRQFLQLRDALKTTSILI